MNQLSATGGRVAAELAVERRGWWGVVRDVVALLKLRITALVLVTSLGGMALAVRMGAATWNTARAALTVVGLCMVVSAANALTMYLERHSDALMERTKNRPLPAGRLSPDVALWLAWALVVLALPVLAMGVNGLTAALTFWALALYAGFYTPLKRVTSQALLVGAVPGALPPLIGWTALAGEVSLPGMALFGVLFFWQVPHFLAIATLYGQDYARAGLKVFPMEHPPEVVRRHAIGHCVALIATSLLLAPSGWGFDGLGLAYFLLAAVLGAGFFAAAWASCDEPRRWARRVFLASLIYLTVLFIGLGAAAWG
jgi:protoheme IX farnesyltransferase